ncbi:MAG: aminomethyl transferase family protein [Dehalococcoidia bacterium]|nr:aminomethyl transferase family protein [Dehalococcoidia bacterium]MSQ17790.1 aminomethyl transferase family protein [Dehalococcoidia bacterium]
MTSHATQRSALHARHAADGARFQTRHGWELPLAFAAGPAAEYAAALHGAALHDRSYAGRLRAAGKDALDLLNRLSSNQVLHLAHGQGAPTILTTDRGRILDLVAVVNTGQDVLLLTSPGLQQAVIQWLDKYTIMEDLTVTDLTPETAMLTVIGPLGCAALEALLAGTGLELAGLAPFHTVAGTLAGQQVRVIHRPLGSLPAYDVVLDGAAALPVWEKLRESGLTPLGLEAWDILRVQQGAPAHGQEMGDDYNPLEAGLVGAISFTKGCYIGQEVIARLDTYQRVQKRLVMLRFSPGAQASQGATLHREGQAVGSVTSVARLPGGGELLGLGYARLAAATVGARLELAPAGQESAGWVEVVQLPLLFGPGAGYK